MSTVKNSINYLNINYTKYYLTNYEKENIIYYVNKSIFNKEN